MVPLDSSLSEAEARIIFSTLRHEFARALPNLGFVDGSSETSLRIGEEHLFAASGLKPLIHSRVIIAALEVCT